MHIHPRQLSEQLATGRPVILIDVRSPVEHDEIRIPGSRLMPLDRLDPAAVRSAASGAERCVLVCHSGKRAGEAFLKLAGAGVENLSVLDGGVMAWQGAGLPAERSERKVLPLMRQVQLVFGLLALAGSILAFTVHPNFALLPAFLGGGLVIAGATGWCGFAMLLARMPWNRLSCPGGKGRTCSV